MPIREICIGIALACALTAWTLSAARTAKILGIDRHLTVSAILAVWLIAFRLLWGHP